MTSFDAGGQTILGCPVSALLSLESACSFTNIPACATASSVNYDAACCGSITSYGYSLLSCFDQHAPTCLDTSAAIASVTGDVTGSNPCAAYATPTAAGTSAGSSPVTGTGSPVGTTPAPGGSSAGAAGTSPSATTTSKSGAPQVGAGLKIYIGVALVGALAVLSM